MNASPLSRLPAELRINIYELALARSEPIRIRYLPYSRYCTTEQALCAFPRVKNATALPRTCRQLRQESDPVLFSSNTFVYLTKGDDPSCRKDAALTFGGLRLLLKLMASRIGDSKTELHIDYELWSYSDKVRPNILPEIFSAIARIARGFPKTTMKAALTVEIEDVVVYERFSEFHAIMDAERAHDGLRKLADKVRSGRPDKVLNDWYNRKPIDFNDEIYNSLADGLEDIGMRCEQKVDKDLVAELVGSGDTL